MNISKQTVNIVDNVCQIKPRNDWDNTYIPHGINEKIFILLILLIKNGVTYLIQKNCYSW